MTHLLLPILLAALPQEVQADDFRFADGLRNVGYFDLAKEVFEKIIATAPNAEEKAKGEIGLARLVMTEAENTDSPSRKLELVQKVTADLSRFLQTYPNHPMVMEVKSDMAELLQQKAEAYAIQARRDRSKLADCERALAEAESMWREIEADLKRDKSISDRDEKYMNVNYYLGLTLWAYVDTMKDFAEKSADVDKKLDQMIALYEDFGWKWDDYLYYFVVCDYHGRALKMKALRASREESVKYWNDCFGTMSAWQNLVSKDHKGNATIEELAARGCLSHMKVMLEYAGTLSGTPALNKYREVAELPEKTSLFLIYKSLQNEWVGKEILVEQAKALYASGDAKKGKKLLDDLVAREKPDSIWRYKVLDVLGEMGGDLDPTQLIEAADAQMNKSGNFMQAAQTFRRAIVKLEAGRTPDLARVAGCWVNIGQCYMWTERYFEAERAFGVINSDARFASLPEDVRKSAMAKQINARKALPHFTEDESYRSWVNEIKEVAMNKFPGMIDYGEVTDKCWTSSTQGQNLIKEARGANTISEKLPEILKAFDDAIATAGRIPQDMKEDYEEALFVKALSSYYAGYAHVLNSKTKKLQEQIDTEIRSAQKRYNDAITAFSEHSRVSASLGSPGPEVSKRALASVKFIARIALDPKFDKPDRALKETEGVAARFGGVSGQMAKDLIEILANRVEARLKLMQAGDDSQLGAAETDLNELTAVFERVRLDSESVARSLIMMANALSAQAKKIKDSDPAGSQAAKDRAGAYFARASDIYDLDTLEDPDLLLQFGQILYDQGMREKNKGILLKAYKLFSRALVLGQRPKEERAAIQRFMGLCLKEAGEIDQAIDEFKAITASDPDRQVFWAWEGLADMYMAKVKQAQKAGRQAEVAEFGKLAADEYGRLAKTLFAIGKMNETYWRLRYKYMAALFESDPDKLYEVLMSDMNRTPYWDDGEYLDEDGVKLQTKFKEIVRKMREKYPSKELPRDPEPKPETPEGGNP